MKTVRHRLVVALVLALLWSTDGAAASKRRYKEDFEFLCSKVKETYPYFADKNINWDSVCKKFARRIRRVKNDVEFVTCCQELIAQLNDSHCGLRDIKVEMPRPERNWCGMTLSPFGEKEAIVLRVAEGTPAAQTGVKPGCVVTLRDGKPIDYWIQRYKEESRRGFSTRQALWYQGVNSIAWGPPGSAAKFGFEVGKKRASSALEFNWGRGDSMQALLPPGLSEGQCLRFSRLEEDVGYVLLRGTPGEGAQPSTEFAEELKRMLAALRGISGVVIDSRMNGGGSTPVGWVLLGCFIKKPVQTVRWGTISPHEDSLGELPVVMLIDAGCISAGDQLADSCKASGGRFKLAGKPTRGSSGQPITIEMPDGLFSVRISSRRFLDHTGRPIEGVGVTPDYPIEWDPQDLAKGQDTFIRKGVELVKSSGRR